MVQACWKSCWQATSCWKSCWIYGFSCWRKIGSLRLVGNPVGFGVFPVGEKLAIYGLLEIPLDVEKILLAFLWQFTAPLDFEKILLAFLWQFTAPLDFDKILLAFPWQFTAPLDVKQMLLAPRESFSFFPNYATSFQP